VLLWRDPLLAGLVIVLAGLAGLVAAAPSLYASSISVASLGGQLSPLCRASAIEPSTRGNVAAHRDLDALAARRPDVFGPTITGLVAARSALGPPPAIVAGDERVPIALATRTGYRDHLGTSAPVSPAGILVPDSLAGTLGLTAGGTVTIEATGGARATLPVSGVFPDLVGRMREPFWCALQPAVQPQLQDEFSPAPALLVDPDDFERLVEQLDLGVTYATWEAPIHVDLTRRDDAARAARAVEELRDEAGPLRASVSSRLPFVVDRAAAVRESVDAGVRPVVLLALVAVGGLAAGVGVLWCTRRRAELQLLWARGVPPWLLAVRAVLELVVAVAGGAVAGWLVAWPLVGALGPGSHLEPGAPGSALRAALVAAPLVLAVMAALVGARMRWAPLPRAIARRGIPLWPVLVAALAWSWWRLSTFTLAVPDGDTLPPIPWETFVVPTVFLLAATSLVVLGVRRLLAVGVRGARLLPTVPYLALRRVAAASTVVLVVCAAAGLAIGVVTYGAGMAGSARRTVDLKLGLGNGAATAAYVLPPGVPAGLEGRATPVVRRDGSFAGQEVDVIAVDPGTFADGAFWDPSFADASLSELMGLLQQGRAAGAQPALAAGPAVPSSGELSFPLKRGGPVPFTIVAAPKAFPGMDASRPLLVVPATALTEHLENVAPVLWTDASPDEVRRATDDTGQRLVRTSTPEGRVDTSVFQPLLWIAAFVQSIGVLLAGLAAGALVTYLGASRRGRALGAELLRRMGLRTPRQWLVAVLELGTLAALALATGVGTGWLSVTALRGMVDAAPSVPPAAVVAFPLPAVTWSVILGLVVVVAATTVATVVADRADIAELLRGDL
jgi:putative ABC transport system permease protein